LSISLQRPAPPPDALPLFSPEAAGRLERFVPPFQFTSFFSPEDTLLCVLAAERAMRAAGGGGSDPRGTHVVELTAGSGLVGFRLLDLAPDARLLGVDVDPAAPPVARRNAVSLGMAERARFTQLSVLDPECEALLAGAPIDVLICNPPYIPEPPGSPLAVEAGSGADGAAHLRRVAELAARVRPRTVALSWCSLGDPVGVTEAMEGAGYRLDALYAVAIADGEYSGTVQPYLETLPTAFLDSAPATRAAMAGDGAARFAYVLLAGAWADGRAEGAERGASAAPAVGALMRGFAAEGLGALRDPAVPCEYGAWVLDRWDEIALRALLHGPAEAARPGPLHAPRPTPAV
jgi:hypothetical protein